MKTGMGRQRQANIQRQAGRHRGRYEDRHTQAKTGRYKSGKTGLGIHEDRRRQRQANVQGRQAGRHRQT